MKYYGILLALCQDLEINPLIEVDFKRTRERLTLGKPLIVKNILFGEEAQEIEKISLVVNNLFMQSLNSIESGSTESGHFANCKTTIIRQIAETYEEVVLFLMNKRLCPDWGFVLDNGLLYKTISEENFEMNFKEANKRIRSSHKILKDAIKLSEIKAEHVK